MPWKLSVELCHGTFPWNCAVGNFRGTLLTLNPKPQTLNLNPLTPNRSIFPTWAPVECYSFVLHGLRTQVALRIAELLAQDRPCWIYNRDCARSNATGLNGKPFWRKLSAVSPTFTHSTRGLLYFFLFFFLFIVNPSVTR